MPELDDMIAEGQIIDEEKRLDDLKKFCSRCWWYETRKHKMRPMSAPEIHYKKHIKEKDNDTK